MSEFVVEFLGRANCQLCAEARPIVQEIVSDLGGVVVDVDIDGSDDLIRSYGVSIPVVRSPGGEVLAEGIIDPKGLKKALKKLRKRSSKTGSVPLPEEGDPPV